MEGKETYKAYSYNKDDQVIEMKAGTSSTDADTDKITDQFSVFSSKGRKTAEGETETVDIRDDVGDYLGRTISETTRYFAADGRLIKTNSSFFQYDGNGNETKSNRTVGNAQEITTSSVERVVEFDDMYRETAKDAKSSLFDGQSGKTVASVEISSDREYDNAWGDLVKESRISVNQDGQTIASYTYERKDDGSSAAQYEYYNEESGRLRKVVREDSAYDEAGDYIRTTSVTNAAGIVTEKATIKSGLADGETITHTEHTKFDSVTGDLKSVTTRRDADGEDSVSEVSIKNAEGIRFSGQSIRVYMNEEGWDVQEIINRRYDPESGTLIAEGKEVYQSLDSDEKWQSKSFRYDQDGKLLGSNTWGGGDLLDEEENVIGYYNCSAFYDAKGNLEDASRQETTYLKDAQGRQVGEKSVTKDQDGNVTSTYEHKRLYDARGIYLGSESTQVDYCSDGSVDSIYKNTYDADTGVEEMVITNAKGRVLYRSTDVPDKVDGHELSRTRTESDYSHHTGNLMTTTTIKTKRENTGVFEEQQRRLKASGQLAHESELSYMFVEGYGFMNYKNVYADYLYRADGSLKYTIDGYRLMDNFYLDLFAGDNYWDDEYLARYHFTEEYETKTAASGILAQEHHLVNNFEQGLDYNEYTVETKAYDEKTGVLRSVTTETSTYDPDLQKTSVRSMTVNAGGALIREETWSYVTDVNGDEVALSEEYSKTFNANTGALLMSSVYSSAGGTGTTETLTYNAAGQVIRKEVQSTGADGVTTTAAYDASGTLLSSTLEKRVYAADGSYTRRKDSVDAAGRAISYEKFYPKEGSGEDPTTTVTFYDQEGAFRKEVTKGNKTVLYNANMQVLSVTAMGDDGVTRTTDANGNLLSYAVLTDKGDFNEFYANGKLKLVVARDDDDELRKTSFDEDGYINYVSIDIPEKNYTAYYDGNGKLAEIVYYAAEGREAYYNAADKQWYSGTGIDKVAIDTPDFAADIDMSDIETGGKARPRGSWYPNNTCCTFGIHLRDIMPELTDKWYTVTPIDLSRNGTQSFELIGGNMWIIGQVNVTVDGDSVLVDYDIILDGKGRTKTITEYFNFFGDLNSITQDALEGDSLDGKGYVFGDPISIEKDLAGDTNVLLYVRNVSTFNTRVYGERYLVRMWENLPERRVRRDAMIEMMDPLVSESAEEVPAN